MERIFSPWRSAYVGSTEKPDGCIFCRAVQNESHPDSLVVHVAERNIVVMNLYPYNSGHVMVAPKRHLARLTEAEPAELNEMMALARQVEGIVTEVYRPEGLNIGMNLGKAAGAGIKDHFHLHVVPRWAGDTNFMSVVGETRVIPEDPVEACARLRPYFRR